MLLAVAAAASGAGNTLAQGSPRAYAAVVCTSEASGPWALKARGTLTRTKSESELAYKFEGGGHAFDWRFVTSPQGNTTVSGPGYLMQRFGAAPESAKSSPAPGERRQSVEASGEIREYAGPNRFVLLVGSKCPVRASR
jgi:hypothetical protein